MIVREGTYQKRLKWGDTVRSEAERLLPDEMVKAVQTSDCNGKMMIGG